MDQVTTYAGVGTADLNASTPDDEPAVIHGIALGEGDVTYGESEKRKYWSAEALQMMEGTLTGQELVVAHENSPAGTVGTVTKDTYEPGVGILYEAEIASHYEEYAADVKAGLLEVSPRIYHPETAQLDRHEESGAWYVDQAHADNLSLVRDGASPSNTAEFGEAEAFAAGPMDNAVAVLSQGSPRPDDADVVETLEDNSRTEPTDTNLNAPEWTAGMFVEWQVNPDMIGQIVHVDDKKDIVMVDIHERTDGRLRSTGYTVSAGYSDIRSLRTQMTSIDENMESEEMEDGSETDDEPESEPDVDESEDDETNDEEAEELSVTSGDTPSDGAGPADTDGETEVDELAPSYSVHEPEFDGEHTDEWEKPTLADFMDEYDLEADSWDDLDEEAQMSIAAHFFLVDGGWPGENYGDLKLPVVEPDGRLSKSALETVLTGRGVQAVEGVSDEIESEVLDMVDDLMANFEDEESDAEADEEAEEMQVGTVATVVSDDRGSATAESEIGEKPHSISQMHQIEYDSANGEEIEELSEPVVVERDELDSVRDDAEQAEELSNELGDLRDDVAELSDARAVVEELSEADRELLKETDATVVESEELEAKEEAVSEVAGIYAEELSEHSPFEAEELTDRFSPVELRERVENHETAELSSTVTETDPEPDAGSVESEELENGRTEAELEEIEETAREEVATLYEQEIGWDEQADKIRSGEIALEELGVDVEEYAE